MKLLIATGNMGKLREFERILKPLLNDVELLTLNDFDKVLEPVEDGSTFLHNAYIKCMYYYNLFKVPTIADDTGLLVKALNNAPGVLTARYGSLNGEHTDPIKNCDRILRELEGITERSAKFQTAMYYYDGKYLVSSIGELNGSIAFEKVGTDGFGYDPIFFVDEYQKTLGEISMDEKNKISHRSKATQMMVKELKSIF